jgi:hypothetical protein
MDIKFDIAKQHGSYIVRRVDGEYKQHAHISTMNGCRLLIRFIRQNRLPTSTYLQGSARRLLTEDEYSQLRPRKQRYHNINKGVRP